MTKSRSSSRWIKRHLDDSYVKKARICGYRSRSSYKLLEINQRDRLLKSGMTVVDLGSSPGGWSQVVTKFIGLHGRIIASDILPMEKIDSVYFIQGDFTHL